MADRSPELFQYKNITGTNGIVDVLPEIRSPQAVFASYDVAERERLQAAGQRLPAQVATHLASNADTR